MAAEASSSAPVGGIVDKNFAATPRGAHFHFGAEEPVRLQAVAGHEAEPVAVLVCHGMGQQVRFETIGQVGAAILKHAAAAGCTIEQNGVQLSQQGKSFLARVELNWTHEGKTHEVHVYEAYWAPITEGKVTYAETLQFLFQAAWRGFRCSRWFRRTTFDRWMFGGMQELSIYPKTKFFLCALAIYLALFSAMIAVSGALISSALAALATAIKAVPITTHDALFSLPEYALRILGEVVRGWLPFLSGSNSSSTIWRWLRLVAENAAAVALIYGGFIARYFLIEYAGDVAAYVSPFKDSKFDGIRSDIQAVGLNVARVIYGFDGVAGVPHYKRVVVAGHSLGSVLAYDTLNAIHNLDLTSAKDDQRCTVKRTTHLITFGSPLDKTAFLFRNQSNHVADPIREQMAAGFQPLIRDYDLFRTRLKWINLWSKMDIISGCLDYYDVVAEGDVRHVTNLEDPDAHTPLKAHVQYWAGKLLAKTLYDAVK